MSQTVLDSKTLVGTDVDDGIGTLQINGILSTKTPPLDDISTKIATFEFMQGQGTGITISTSEPINPDLSPENKKWIQIDDNKMIVNVFEWDSVNGWNIQ